MCYSFFNPLIAEFFYKRTLLNATDAYFRSLSDLKIVAKISKPHLKMQTKISFHFEVNILTFRFGQHSRKRTFSTIPSIVPIQSYFVRILITTDHEKHLQSRKVMTSQVVQEQWSLILLFVRCISQGVKTAEQHLQLFSTRRNGKYSRSARKRPYAKGDQLPPESPTAD